MATIYCYLSILFPAVNDWSERTHGRKDKHVIEDDYGEGDDDDDDNDDVDDDGGSDHDLGCGDAFK